MEELADLLGESPAIKAVREKLRQLLERQPAGRHLPAILIQGETGTGKGLVARLVHRLGPRKSGPFVDINCPAIPETLLEAELFGYERGAFTDARHAKAGLFQTAHRGTLFLDEVGLLSASVQAKLLTVLEDRAVRRLGGTKLETVDACIISATNLDLSAALRTGRFREDLYHRLSVIRLDLPPLRDRGEDVFVLAERFLARACLEYERPMQRLSEEARARLLAYRWPGNIRELANVIERAVLFNDSPMVTSAMLEPLSSESVHPAAVTPPGNAESVAPEEAMRQHLRRVLEMNGGNISRAADQLGIARNTLYARLEKYGVGGYRPRGSPSRRPGPPESAAAAPVLTRQGLQWERHGLTLLGAALVGADGRDDESTARGSLDAVLDKLQAFGGRVEELTPTSVVASFGADRVDDPPRRAAHAAMAIQRDVERTRADTGRMRGVKIGIHVAQVLVGLSASRIDIDAGARRAEWPVLDQLLESGGPDQTVVSAAAVAFLERRFELVPLDGRAGGANRAYRLTGQERPGFGLWGVMTQFVGRRDELATLRGCAAAVRLGDGHLLDVVGEPGVGKSRLLWEFGHSTHVAGWLVLEAGAVPYGKHTPYLPVIDLLKTYCGVSERDDQRTIREKVAGKVLALDRTFEAALPALLALLDLPVEDEAWQALDPAGRRSRTLDALKRLLLRESQAQPLALVFEDLQWIDGETQALLDSLVEALPGSHLFLLVSHRPEYVHRWDRQGSFTQLRLEPLSRGAGEMLLEVLLGTDPGLGTLKELLIERTEGNPLFIEESIRALAETGTLTGTRGAYRLTRDLPAIDVPETVQAILRARIDRLPADEKHLLQIAAVIGKDCPFALLKLIASQREDVLRRTLSRLETAEFVHETRLSPDVEYTFKHALTHEVAYGSLRHDQRRDIHARIVGAMEQFYGERLGEHIERLARHAFRGEVGEKAVRYLRQAGLRAAGRSALKEARIWLEQGLDVLAALPESPATMQQAFEICLDLRSVLNLLGEVRRALEHLSRAEILAEELDDDSRRARVCVFMTNVHALLGEIDEALAWGARSMAFARRLDDVKLRIQTTSYLEQVHYYEGDYVSAVELATDNLATLPADWIAADFRSSMPTVLWDRLWLVYSLAELGRFDEAVSYGTELLALAEPTERTFAVSEAYISPSRIHLLKGEWLKALALVEQGIAVLRGGNTVLNLPTALAWSAWILAQVGEVNDALARVREAERLIDRISTGNVVLNGLSYQSLARAYLLLDLPGEASRLGARAVECAPSRRGVVAHALHLLGDIAARPKQFDAEAAEVHYRRALALAEPRRMQPLVAHCHLGLSKLYGRTGKLSDAEEHVTIATGLYRGMGMQFWLEQAEEAKWSAGGSMI